MSPSDAPEGKVPTSVIGVGAAVLIVVLAVLFFRSLDQEPDAATVEVSGHRWTRTIEVEEFKASPHSRWKSEMPSTAYDTKCRSMLRSTERVADGEICSRRRRLDDAGVRVMVEECAPKMVSKPKYEDKCAYLVDRWTRVRTAEIAGQSVQDIVRWPDTNLSKQGRCRGCQREGKKTERYLVDFTNPRTGETDHCPFPFEQWRSIRLGEVWTTPSGEASGVDCAALTRK